MQPFSGNSIALAGINQGNADAGIFTAPTTLKASHAGLKELVNVTEKNIPMIHAAFASTKEFVRTQPDKVRRFLQAYLEGIKVAVSDAELAKQIIGKYTKTTDAADLESSYQTFLPAILIARLAIDSRCQGRGVGTQLLIAALHRLAELSTEVGFEVIVVHALSHDASVFYRRAGFIPAQDEPLHLYLPVRDLRRTFGIG